MKYLLIFVVLALIPICYSANLTANSTSSKSPNDSGLTKEQKRMLVKAHAILMIIGWLLFVPTGFLFARLGRDLYKDKKLFGCPVWFQVHQISNYIAVGCICVSMLCVFVSQNFHWKGSFSGSKYWTEWHTDLGVISTVLAVIQPINSYFRCGPAHANRAYFNWAHRIIGIVGYLLAFITTLIAALQFRKIWNEPLLEVVLVSAPSLLAFVLTVASSVKKNDNFRHTSDSGADDSLLSNRSSPSRDLLQPYVLRVPAIYMSIGAFLASAIALSLLVVNGYKNV